jgi:hypothetical protein
MSKFQENFYKGIGTFIATILIFLSTIFPNNKGLMVYRQTNENGLDIYGPIIVEAVKNKDVATIRDLMCANIKKNIPNLDREIQNFYDLMEGNYVSERWREDYYLEGDNISLSREKGQINQSNFNFWITTTIDEYHIRVTWETVNNMKPEETKIRAINLFIMEPDETGVSKAKCLYKIAATEGVMAWHD